MKKIFSYIIVALMAISCSSDSNSSDSGVLVKKIIYTSNVSSDTTEITYTYQGNKLDQLFKNGILNIQYYYSGDLLDHTEMYSASGTEVDAIFKYTYDAEDRLIKAVIYDVNLSQDTFRETYNYNSDGTVSVGRYRFTIDRWTAYAPCKFFIDSNGEIVKKEYDLSNGTTVSEICSYDQHPNPFKNVLGFDKLLDQIEGMHFNLVSVEGAENPYDNILKTYTYESNGFPSVVIRTQPNVRDGVTTRYNYFY